MGNIYYLLIFDNLIVFVKFLHVYEKNSQVILESLILAQSERWRRGLGMQVERSLSETH